MVQGLEWRYMNFQIECNAVPLYSTNLTRLLLACVRVYFCELTRDRGHDIVGLMLPLIDRDGDDCHQQPSICSTNFLGGQVQCRHATFNSAVNHSLDKVSIINYMR